MKNELKENGDLVLFENKKIRRQEYKGEWYYSIVDIIEILTESKDSGAYWRKLKQRLKEEDFSESVTNCHELKFPSKKREKNIKQIVLIKEELIKNEE